jgi:Cu2+-containing amine oxidase
VRDTKSVRACSPQGDATVVSWRPLDGVHPMTTPDDNDHAEAIMKADPEIRRLVAERYGITDPAHLACDTWACHNAPAHLQSRRLMQVGFLLCFLLTEASLVVWPAVPCAVRNPKTLTN